MLCQHYQQLFRLLVAAKPQAQCCVYYSSLIRPSPGTTSNFGGNQSTRDESSSKDSQHINKSHFSQLRDRIKMNNMNHRIENVSTKPSFYQSVVDRTKHSQVTRSRSCTNQSFNVDYSFHMNRLAPIFKRTIPGCVVHAADARAFIHTSSTVRRMNRSPDYPALDESELEETFVRGSGPGGQKINKTSSCVVLKHLPTGIVVKCQESRSLEINRQRARRHVQERLDVHLNGPDSHIMKERQRSIEKKQKKKSATNRKLRKLAEMRKESEQDTKSDE